MVKKISYQVVAAHNQLALHVFELFGKTLVTLTLSGQRFLASNRVSIGEGFQALFRTSRRLS